MIARFLGALALTFACAAPITCLAADDQEAQIGVQVYDDLKKKGEILSSSPYYSILNPIATRIKRVADSQYDYPFHFILVHEKDPNAFAVPGGNVYVTDSLMKFVENKEELAGVLCHETSHDIHHDVVNNMVKDQRLSIAATALDMLLGNAAGGLAQTAIGYAANFEALHFSRQVESAADIKGSDTCAQAGYNPWGMVWLFSHFEKANTNGSMEMLSDHPTDSHRISMLETHFQENPTRFGHFSSDIHTGTALAVVGQARSTPTRRPRVLRRVYAPAPRIQPQRAQENRESAPEDRGRNGDDGDVPRFP